MMLKCVETYHEACARHERTSVYYPTETIAPNSGKNVKLGRYALRRVTVIYFEDMGLIHSNRSNE